MPFMPSMDATDGVPHAFQKFNTGTGKPLIEFHQILMRSEDSPLTVAERELIAGYVSGVNACRYCHGAHTRAAEFFGVPEGLITSLLDDLENADIDEKMKPLLAYTRKLTEAPTKLTQADADAVFAAGWNERALYDAIQVCALFNFMNRFVEGLGIDFLPPRPQLPEGEKPKIRNYTDLIEMFGIK